MMAGADLAFPPPAAADSLEYAVKAAYLVKFIPFIDWPDGVFASPDQPVTICVLGDDPFGGKLDAAAGQKSGERAVAVKHLQQFDPSLCIWAMHRPLRTWRRQPKASRWSR